MMMVSPVSAACTTAPPPSREMFSDVHGSIVTDVIAFISDVVSATGDEGATVVLWSVSEHQTDIH